MIRVILEVFIHIQRAVKPKQSQTKSQQTHNKQHDTNDQKQITKT